MQIKEWIVISKRQLDEDKIEGSIGEEPLFKEWVELMERIRDRGRRNIF